MEEDSDNKQPRHLIGVGLDNEDGHKRLTRAESFSIIGGSEKTHERMTETLMKTVQDLRNEGKKIDDLEPEELSERLHDNTPR